MNSSTASSSHPLPKNAASLPLLKSEIPSSETTKGDLMIPEELFSVLPIYIKFPPTYITRMEFQ